MLDTKFITIEEGMEKLRGAVNTRNMMGGVMYFNICEEDCLRIADRLVSMGADKNTIAEIGGWELRR